MQVQRRGLHLGRQVAPAAPAAGAARARVVEHVAGDHGSHVRRQAQGPRRVGQREHDVEAGGRGRRLAAAEDASDAGVGRGGHRDHRVADRGPRVAAGRAHADERGHAEHQQLLDHDRGRRRAHHRGLDRHRDAVDRARVAEQAAVRGHQPAGLEAAVEAGGDARRSVRVAGQQHDGGVVAGLGVEVDLRHRVLRWRAVRRSTRRAGSGQYAATRGLSRDPARRCSTIVHRSMTTDSPASWAIRPASSFAMPSWSHRQRAPDRDGLARVLDAQVGAAEHVDDVDRPGRRDGVGDGRVARLAVDLRLARVHGDDVVARPAQAPQHAVGRPGRVRRRPDERDPRPRAEQLPDAVVVEQRHRETGPRRSRSAPPRGPDPRPASPSVRAPVPVPRGPCPRTRAAARRGARFTPEVVDNCGVAHGP